MEINIPSKSKLTNTWIYNTYFHSTIVQLRVIYVRIQNRKNYSEIAAFFNFKQGTSRAVENKNTNKHISVISAAVKCNIILSFPAFENYSFN